MYSPRDARSVGDDGPDPLGTPTPRIHDTHGNRDRALEPGTFGAAWRADGALAYARGDPVSYRANLPYLTNVVVRASATADPLAWTEQADRYRVYGWAGDRLIVTRGQEGGEADAEVLDRPGKIRLLPDRDVEHVLRADDVVRVLRRARARQSRHRAHG